MVTEENTAVSFHGKEKSEDLGLKVSVIFFTLSHFSQPFGQGCFCAKN